MVDRLLLDDWHPVARADAIQEGAVIAARLLGEELVLWRAGGAVQAWQDRCVHRGARLSMGKVHEGTLRCPYHGWRYVSGGRCVHIPAHPGQTPPTKAHVQTFHTQERCGLVWVCLGEPANEVPGFPEESDLAYRKVLSGPYGPVNACAPRVIENFLDVAHFPFIHPGTLGDESRPEIDDYTVETGPDGIWVPDVRVYQPDPYGTGVGDIVRYEYRVIRPLTAYLAKETGDGIRFSILFPITPIDETTSIAWFYMAMTSAYSMSDEELSRFHGAILAQDVPIVESQRPARLPLDLSAELHVRCDRTSIAYRRWLKDLGLTYGVA